MSIFDQFRRNREGAHDLAEEIENVHEENERHKMRQKRLFILIGGGLTLFVFLGLYLFGPKPENRQAQVQQLQDAKAAKTQYRITTPGATTDDKEVWMQRGEGQMSAMQKSLMEMQEQMQRESAQRDAQFKRLESQGLGPAAKEPTDGYTTVTLPALPPAPVNGYATEIPLSPQAPANQPGGSQRQPVVQPGQPMPQPGQPAQQQVSPIFVIDIPVPDKEKKPVTATRSDAYIPAGTFTRAELLSGLDAPTGGNAQNNPQPVLMRLVDLSSLPNRESEDLKECRVLGSGYGDISSERAYIRLTTLSCVTTSGKPFDKPIKGFVAGEDGKVGMRGRLVSKQGQMLAKALLAGLASGIGKGFNASTQITSTSPLGTTQALDPKKIGQSALAGGVDNAMSKLADYYMQQADQLYPVIEVDAGRKIDLVLTSGSNLPRMDETQDEWRASYDLEQQRAADARTKTLAGQETNENQQQQQEAAQ